ncbi:MAG: NAD(P)H-hydrate dehydratase [Puniceicoccales bacterium]|nr:NAD(P)H-hydrate dehydratase [Puniceicoccales bacterium]
MRQDFGAGTAGTTIGQGPTNVFVLAGKGHNAADALWAAAEILRLAGCFRKTPPDNFEERLPSPFRPSYSPDNLGTGLVSGGLVSPSQARPFRPSNPVDDSENNFGKTNCDVAGEHTGAEAGVGVGVGVGTGAKTQAGALAKSVTVLLATPPEQLSPAAAQALAQLAAKGARVRVWASAAEADALLAEIGGSADVLLDGLLGYNFRPPLRPPFDEIIRWANAHGAAFAVKVAVDLPSGIGDFFASVFHADATVACGILKTPLLEPCNAEARGRLRYADIGFPASPASQSGARRVANAAVLEHGSLRRLRPPLADKRDFGHLFVLGGSRSMPGALLMNVRAALRSGVGLLTAFCPESVAAAFAAVAPEAMWVPWPETPSGGLALEGMFLLREKLPRATALLCGSGAGAEPETLALLADIAANTPCPLVLDADALRPEIAAAATSRPAALPTLLLPHAGELARVAPEASAEVAAGAVSPETLRGLCQRLRACVALKGAPTRVADASCEVVVCAGGPVLARGGSGDLLAGIAGALLARRFSADPLRTLVAAVAWHGAAADKLARRRGAEAVATTDILSHL